MSAEQLARYEDWIRELEARQATLAGSRRRYLRFFVGVMVASIAGFVWSAWVGAATLFTGVLFCLFGVYVVLGRERDYRDELAATRRTVRDLRRALATNGTGDMSSRS